MPFKEHDISISLHTPYQVTKLVGELYTNYFHNLYDLPIVNARFFNVFGPGEVPGKYRNVIPNFFYWAMNKQPLPITGDGSETRDWTYVGDIVNGLLAMGICEEAVGEAINLGSAVETKVLDMAKVVNKLTGNSAGITYIERRNWDVKIRLLSSIDKAKKIIDYKPQTEFNTGLKQVYKWLYDNWDEIQNCAEF
jgi:nucleoside-diphosphate-sugar epimerase